MEFNWWILTAGAVVAGFVQGLSGFAFAMVASSIWAWALPPQLVAVMGVSGALAGQVFAFLRTRRALDLPRLAPLVLGGLGGLPLGLWLLPRMDTAVFQIFVGGLLALWCPAMLISGRLPHITVGGRWADAAAGAAGGFAGALGGFTGPLPTLWCTLRGWDKDALRSAVQNFNLTLLAATFVSYGATGVITAAMLPPMGVVAVLVLLPVLLGTRLYGGISADAFRRLLLSLLSCCGAALLVKSAPVLWARLG